MANNTPPVSTVPVGGDTTRFVASTVPVTSPTSTQSKESSSEQARTIPWPADSRAGRGNCAYVTSSLALLNRLNLTNKILVLWILGIDRLHGLLEWSLNWLYDNRAVSDQFVH